MRTSSRARLTAWSRVTNRIRLNDAAWLALLVGLALALRLGYALIDGKATLAWGDEFTYDQLATNLLAHGCYCFIPGEPSVLRAPLYPAFMAVVYAMLGHSYLAVVILQAIAGALGAALLALIGMRITGSRLAGWLAGLMFAVNPLLIFTSNLLYPETIYLLLLFALLYLWLRLAASPRETPPGMWIVMSVASGVLLGLSNLTKPNLTLFPIWLAAWGWIAFRDVRRALVTAVVVGAAMLVAMLPWSLRNLSATGHFILASANSGMNLLQGNNPEVSGGALDVKNLDPLPGLTEAERDAAYWQMGMQWITSHPGDFIRLIPHKLYKFFSPLETSNRGTLASSLGGPLVAGFSAHYLLAIAGVVLTAKQWREWTLPYMLIVYPMLLTIVFYGGTRYGLVVQPFLMLFASVALAKIIQHVWPFAQKMRRGHGTPWRQ